MLPNTQISDLYRRILLLFDNIYDSARIDNPSIHSNDFRGIFNMQERGKGVGLSVGSPGVFWTGDAPVNERLSRAPAGVRGTAAPG